MPYNIPEPTGPPKSKYTAVFGWKGIGFWVSVETYYIDARYR